ncbi:uncharacterized protein LOC144934353 isoform X2 [Lampetra fluviatilis]
MSNKGGSIRQRLREQPPPRCRRAAPSPSFTPLCLAVGAAAGCQGALGSALRGAGVAFNREGQRRAPPPQPPGSVESPSTCRRRRISLLPPRGLVRSRPSTSSRAGAAISRGHRVHGAAAAAELAGAEGWRPRAAPRAPHGAHPAARSASHGERQLPGLHRQPQVRVTTTASSCLALRMASTNCAFAQRSCSNLTYI